MFDELIAEYSGLVLGVGLGNSLPTNTNQHRLSATSSDTGPSTEVVCCLPRLVPDPGETWLFDLQQIKSRFEGRKVSLSLSPSRIN